MTQTLNIANFICKFGDDLVLLDMLEEVVIPAFNQNRLRNYGDDVRYFFHDVRITDLSKDGDNEITISGRLVKEGKVARDQVFKAGAIVKDRREMETAPTSFFVLLLSNHKLLYVRETPGAPGLSTFESTVNAFMRESYRTWLDEELENRETAGEKITKKALIQEVPAPVVEVVELSTDSEIRKFIKKFKVINAVEIQLLNTNHEADNAPLFRKLRGIKDKLGSDQLTIKNTKGGKVGLNQANVIDLVAGQAEEANSRIILRGTDLEGEKMRAVNDHFKLGIEISNLPETTLRAMRSVYATFLKQVRAGALNVKAAPAAALKKMDEFRAQKR